MRGSILPALLVLFALLGLELPSLRGATTITDDSSGVVVFRKKGFDSLDKPIIFRRISQDQAYFDLITPSDYLIHIESDLVVKVVFFINTSTFPTRFDPEDLAVIKAKIDQLHAVAALSPETAAIVSSHLKYLQDVYDVESARYKQSLAIATQKFASDQEKAAFDKQCDLLWLDLQASAGDLAHSEEDIKKMEPLAPRSELLTGVLARWNLERNRALQLAGECRDLWAAAQKNHPANFKPAPDLKSLPAFPPDLKEKIAGLQQQLDQFRAAATIPQTTLYCKNEIPALFLLNELPKLVEKIKTPDYAEAAALSHKALQQVTPDQITPLYAPIYDTFKNCTSLVDDIRARYFRQLSQAQTGEGTLTARETLDAYQKAYDIIPEPEVAAKIDQLKEKIKNQ